ncbi:hypothetical protein ACOSQ2_029509 [Xanthoceras sorbifolium]|uniref:Nodulation-signaling pathway 2 protein-like n=1 Tax=Xanthoceras sorbifolium TaxID=99658 RepID=A0ABQ8HBL4_9ROSI|nr:hypothetical protein JRO89_XS12G0072300 [Xanthoceras sorbifolium]
MIQPDRFHQQPGSHSNLFEYLSVDEFTNYGEEMEGLVNGCHIHEPLSPPFTITDENNSLETSPTNVVNFSSISDQEYFENHNNIFSFQSVNEIVSQFTFSRENNVVNLSSSLDNLEDLNSVEMEEVREWLAVDDDHDDRDREETAYISSQDDQVVFSSVLSMDVASIKPSLLLPTEDMELEHQLGSNHLAKAYTEAIQNQHRELAAVIVRRINEKVSPVGEARERLLYHSFHALDKQADGYLKHESSKVFHAAFEAIYRIFVNGMFAHCGANSAILETMPRDTEVLHIVDFDIGEGIQWSSLIISLAQQQKLLRQQHSFGFVPHQVILKITSIKWKEDTNSSHLPAQWRFEETKKRLQEYANFHGLMRLKVEEIELQDLLKEIKTTKKRRELFAFNCMWALPHMGRRRSRRIAMEFLNAAKGFLADYNESYGVITYGDGENVDRIINHCSCFGSFFESYMKHYQKLLESMEWILPPRLAEARIAMESLFVAPYVSSQALPGMWREMKEVESAVCGGFQLLPAGVFGLKVSSERLMEAKVMVREGDYESLYTVKIEGENNFNEMVLEWKETPLVRVSAWRS